MRKFVMLIVGMSVLLLGLDLARMLWLGKGEEPNEAYRALTEPPPRTLANAKSNGYFLLLGIAASESSDPVQAGYHMWLEVESDRGHRYFDYSRESRLAFRVEDETLQALRAWEAPDIIPQLRALGEAPRTFFTEQAPLLDRYRRWLTMPFEDWGYGHPGSPRFVDSFAAHRLYVAEGFALNVPSGLDRLEKDMAAWRVVLAKAKTLSLKVMAAHVVADDVRLLSRLLSRRDLDPALLLAWERAAQPLTTAERSLRWPIQNEFLVGVAQSTQSSGRVNEIMERASENHERWLAAAVGLDEDAFQQLDASLPHNAFGKAPAQIQRTLNLYANYYEAVIKATETLPGPLPKLHDFASSRRRVFDSILNPIDNVFASGTEPAWEPFTGLLLETDARLRLAALQTRLGKPSPNQQVVVRIVQVGHGYYDPFTSLPMLWNPSTGRLYSVGRDGKDDGGDEVRDISVAVVLPQAVSAPAARPAGAGRVGQRS